MNSDFLSVSYFEPRQKINLLNYSWQHKLGHFFLSQRDKRCQCKFETNQRGFISQGSLLLKKTQAFKEDMTDFLPKCSQLAETVELCEFTVNGTGRCYEYVLILKSNNCKSDPITHAGGKRGWSKTPRVFLDKVETKPS